MHAAQRAGLEFPREKSGRAEKHKLAHQTSEFGIVADD